MWMPGCRKIRSHEHILLHWQKTCETMFGSFSFSNEGPSAPNITLYSSHDKPLHQKPDISCNSLAAPSDTVALLINANTGLPVFNFKSEQA